jgi:hypothetical protein
MAYTSKHGKWFPFAEHIHIHDQVLKQFEYQMLTPQEYSFDYLQKDILRHYVEFEFRHNGYKVKIEKKSKIKFKKSLRSGQVEPDEALTTFYNYVARNSDKGHSLRYCSPHESFYDSQLPWHHKHHRHESLSPGSERISVFDNNDRPIDDQGMNQFYVGRKTIHLTYLGQLDWPNVKEFLKEVNNLV